MDREWSRSILTHDGAMMEPTSHKGNHQDGLTNKSELDGISQNGPELARMGRN